MPPTVQVGAILMKDWPAIKELLGLEWEPYSGQWVLLKTLDVCALDRKIHAAGWNFFFMASEVKVMFFGSIGAAKVHNALKRILEKVRQHHFNGLEVTAIVTRHFLGIRYVTVSAHSRHTQHSYISTALKHERRLRRTRNAPEGEHRASVFACVLLKAQQVFIIEQAVGVKLCKL